MNELLESTLSAPSDLPPRKLSDDLRELLRASAGRALTLGELESSLQGRGFALLILLMSLPFCFPVSIPGLSMPFGVVIMFLGFRLACGRKPSLPGFVLKREIQFSTLEKIVGFGLKLATRMEKIAKPRMQFLHRWPGMTNLIGVGLALGGLLLLLPLPPLIPLSNTIPAISVVLLTAGLVERDGVFVLAGYGVNLLAWVYFIFMFVMGGEGIRHLLRFFGA
jgi:hypothetical protein